MFRPQACPDVVYRDWRVVSLLVSPEACFGVRLSSVAPTDFFPSPSANCKRVVHFIFSPAIFALGEWRGYSQILN